MSFEVAVACDVRLGALVAKNPEVSHIDVDPAAVRLGVLACDGSAGMIPGSDGEILFIASHYDSVQSKRDKSKLLGNYRKKKPHKNSARIPTARVSVGGDPETRLEAGTPQYDESIRVSVQETMSVEKTVELYMANVSPLRFTPQEDIQKVSAHELSHAADAMHPSNSWLKLHSQALKTGLMVGSADVLMYAAGGLGSRYALPKLGLDLRELPIGLAPAAIGLAASVSVSQVIFNSGWNHKRYMADPTEERARQNEKHAADLPPIVTIVRHPDQQQ